MKARALFLDRDGVVNREINYLHQIKDFSFIDGIFELCHSYQQKGYKLFIITNQAGIARGFYSEKDYWNLTDWMVQEFLKKDIIISKVYYCPHHPKISGECFCRKPNPGLILEAKKEFDLDLANSVLIGDKISDIEAGKNAGIGLNILISPNKIPGELYKITR